MEIGTTRPTQVYHYEYILDVINCKSPESEAMEMTLIHVEFNSMGIQLGIRHTDGMYIIFYLKHIWQASKDWWKCCETFNTTLFTLKCYTWYSVK